MSEFLEVAWALRWHLFAAVVVVVALVLVERRHRRERAALTSDYCELRAKAHIAVHAAHHTTPPDTTRRREGGTP